MARTAFASLALLALLAVATAGSTGSTFEGASSFISSFNTAAPLKLPGAELRLVTAASLFGLELTGLSALHVKLDACTILQSHIHPHPEFLYDISGKLTHSIPYNNGTLTTITSNTDSTSPKGFVTFPTGVLHVTQNEGCRPAEFVSVFPTGTPDLYFFPYTEGFQPDNTISSYFGGKVSAADLKSVVGTAKLSGCKCSRK